MEVYLFLLLASYIIGDIAAPFLSNVRLVSKSNNSYSGHRGVVQVQVNGTWNYLNGSDWDYADALVSCRELGIIIYAMISFII